MTILCDRSLRVAQTVRPLAGDYNVALIGGCDVDRALHAAARAERWRLRANDLPGDQRAVSGGIHEAEAE